MERAQLGENVLVPVGMRADHSCESAHAVGEPANLRVDQPRGQFIPRRVSRQHRIAETGAHTILEPAIELGETRCHPRDAIVAATGWIALRYRRQHRMFVRLRVG